MDEDMSVLAMAYVKEHTDELSQMLATLWRLIECRDNMEKEMEVFKENKRSFGDAGNYVDYAIEMRHLCYTHEYQNLLRNRMDVESVTNNRYLYNLLYSCLCEWEESSSRRRVARIFLAYIPGIYMETIWRRAGAIINGVPEEEVVPEMVWMYPKKNIFESMEASSEKQKQESPNDTDKSAEDYAEIKAVLDDIHMEADELITAYREVLESLTTDELKRVVERMDVSERGWCILYAEKERRMAILNSIENTTVRLLCLKESIAQGEGKGMGIPRKKKMPMSFFEKCGVVKGRIGSEFKE